MNATQLPAPSAHAQQHSQQLSHLIRERIHQAGTQIPFNEFMQLALYTPGLGYYCGGAQKFAAAGDFITAPEISPLFGHCLANQCLQVLSITGGDILEFGAGSGKLALDLLSRLKQLNALPTHYYILEVSAELIARQKHTIKESAPDLYERITWLNQLPTHFTGVMLANEVLDAMPIHHFYFDNNQLHESFVSEQSSGFCWSSGQPTSLLQPHAEHLIKTLPKIDRPYCSEINCFLPAFITSLSESLTQGAVFLIDYGFPAHEFYHPDRYMGTLMCHYRHFAHTDPFFLPGLQDITAHVDFTAVAHAAVQAGFDVLGFTNQASFLINAGLVEIREAITATKEQIKANQAIKKLSLPSEMGELFKIIALGQQINDELIGFQANNQLFRL
jgi:SAM-dependent MidA family methyltransferase